MRSPFADLPISVKAGTFFSAMTPTSSQRSSAGPEIQLPSRCQAGKGLKCGALPYALAALIVPVVNSTLILPPTSVPHTVGTSVRTAGKGGEHCG